MPHQGRPLAVLENILDRNNFAGAAYFGVSGRLGHISEAAATQRALRELKSDVNAVVSLGGESFLVYIVVQGRINNVLSHNKCAAGSGEFFVQQIGRMGLGMEDAIRDSFAGKVVPLAARCSVHCKSDITHKLNRNEATPEDILHTLHDSIIGPFNCLPFRIAEAILKPLSIRSGMPILTYESDGCTVSPSFMRQVEVHTQQVLDHHMRPLSPIGTQPA